MRLEQPQSSGDDVEKRDCVASRCVPTKVGDDSIVDDCVAKASVDASIFEPAASASKT
jgi:hypothetical protein